ncbi:hypothetical protein BDN67DRAFT_757927 [Paxillus ammoniavirescens]|nr:hypothetical protein BDN67DRAFT_757927 [Paxillus ammoniavirescens]
MPFSCLPVLLSLSALYVFQAKSLRILVHFFRLDITHDLVALSLHMSHTRRNYLEHPIQQISPLDLSYFKKFRFFPCLRYVQAQFDHHVERAILLAAALPNSAVRHLVAWIGYTARTNVQPDPLHSIILALRRSSGVISFPRCRRLSSTTRYSAPTSTDK